MINVVLFGPPGVGKGTQSKKLIQRYKFVHIAAGDLLREQVNRKTALGNQIANYINIGRLAPNALVSDIVAAQIVDKQNHAGFLFDGFPRTVDQAKKLDGQLANCHMKLDVVILLEAPEKELIKRIKARATVENRIDDQDATRIATRMQIYQSETVPVANYYAQQGKLFKIAGVGTIDVIFQRIVAVLANLYTHTNT